MENKVESPLVLVVDDDMVIRRFLCANLQKLGYKTLEAENGRIALELVEANVKDLMCILLDRQMPEMNGIETVQHLQKNPDYKHLPIIMLTADDNPLHIREGIEEGIFYYLTKPILFEVLKSVVGSAVGKSQQHKNLAEDLEKHRGSFMMMHEGRFSYKTLKEAGQLATFLANCFPNTDQVLTGLAELMYNAVEHGNLGLTHEDKTGLLESDELEDYVAMLLEKQEFKERKVDVFFKRTEKGCKIVIEDEGKGFDWQSFLVLDPARASQKHGRGIAQANHLSFDKIIYNEKGNQVTAYVLNAKKLEW